MSHEFDPYNRCKPTVADSGIAIYVAIETAHRNLQECIAAPHAPDLSHVHYVYEQIDYHRKDKYGCIEASEGKRKIESLRGILNPKEASGNDSAG